MTKNRSDQTIKLNGESYNRQNLDELRISNEPDDSWRNAIHHFLTEWFDDNEFITAQTSGSTGKPKSIRLSKTSMENSALMTNRFFGLTPKNTALLCLPVLYIAGKMMLVRALVGGFNLLTVAPAANPFEEINTTIDFTAITPYQFQHSANTLRHKAVGKIIVGGSQLTLQLQQLAETIPAELYETYGMTETCSHIALRRINGTEQSDYFTILEGVSIRQDDRGCLIIEALHLLEAEIITNDVVELIDEQSFRWLGRADSTINSGGIKIHPEQVEKKLQKLILHNFFISSLPDENFGEKVVLVIESNPYTLLNERIVKVEMESLLDKYEIPKQILYISPFIYSESKKVLRKETLDKAIQK